MNLEEKKKFIINFIFLALWSIIIFLLFKFAFVYLLPFIIGIVIAYVVQKPAKFFSSKTILKQQNCAAVLSVFVFIVLIAICVLFGWLLYSQLSNILKSISPNGSNIRKYVMNFYTSIETYFKNSNNEIQVAIKELIEDFINNFITKLSSLISNVVTSFVKSLPSLFINCVVTIVATCYLSKDFKRFTKFITGFISNSFCEKIIKIKDIFTECFLKFVIGYLWLFVITFFELVVGFYLLKIKHNIILALIVAVVDLLPVVGTGTFLLPWAAVMFFQQKYSLGIGIVILYLFIVIIRNFLEPKIISKQLGVTPFFTLVFIFLGLKFGGVLGMVIFPIVLTVAFTYLRGEYLEI